MGDDFYFFGIDFTNDNKIDPLDMALTGQALSGQWDSDTDETMYDEWDNDASYARTSTDLIGDDNYGDEAEDEDAFDDEDSFLFDNLDNDDENDIYEDEDDDASDDEDLLLFDDDDDDNNDDDNDDDFDILDDDFDDEW